MAVYFAYNERLSEPILLTQVVNLLSDFNNSQSKYRFKLFIFQNPYFWIKERSARHEIVAKAGRAGLELVIFPFALPTRGWLRGRLGIRLHRALFALTSFFIPSGTVICRGYLSTFLCLNISKPRKFNVIGDLRSLYVRENIGNKWNDGDKKHKFWLSIEQEIVRRANKIIVVNVAMYDYYHFLLGSKSDRIVLIPIYSKLQTPIDTDKPVSARIRLIYVGSLSQSKWNDINAYRKFFWSLAQIAERIELVLIVKEGGPLIDALREALSKMGFPFVLHVNLTPAQVQKELSQAHVGLMITDPWADANARTGIKTIEYLANGLIIWTTKQFGEIAKMVNDTDTGFVFNTSSPQKIELVQALNDIEIRSNLLISNAKALYKSNFFPESILLMYNKLLAIADEHHDDR